MLQTNAKTAYLVFVSPDNNHNKFYRMIPNVPDITRFTAEYGRVGAAGMKRSIPSLHLIKYIMKRFKRAI